MLSTRLVPQSSPQTQTLGDTPCPPRGGTAPSLVQKLEKELVMRLQAPQRYRLLQGYPMPALMPLHPVGVDPLGAVAVDLRRPLIVGVLPHTSCAPSITGCGFCTFPHERYQASQVLATTLAVTREIESVRERHPEWLGRKVDAVYLGGGTANLTPAEGLSALCTALAGNFDLQDAEITLEGAPSFFLGKNGRLLDVLRSTMPTERLRLSMGIQTFNPEQIRNMGREAIGSRASVEEAVRLAQRRGFTTSGDFLINLPGQSSGDMLDDIILATSLGLDQICVYHLVLFPGLGTAWSRDSSKLSQLPMLKQARENWMKVRRGLLEHGYVQTSLTNFERASVHRSERRFLYEECSFHPEVYDALGFGPAALSTFSDLPTQTGIKTMNEPEAALYREHAPGEAVVRHFVYGEEDLKLLYLTRHVSGLRMDRLAYRSAYGTDPVEDFRDAFAVLTSAGLVNVRPDEIELTAKGMFFADAVAGLLASQRVQQLRLARGAGDANRAAAHWMG